MNSPPFLENKNIVLIFYNIMTTQIILCNIVIYLEWVIMFEVHGLSLSPRILILLISILVIAVLVFNIHRLSMAN